MVLNRGVGRPSVPPNQTSVAHGDSAMSLDSRQTVLGLTSRPVVTAVGRGIDEARFPRSPSIECHSRFGRGRGNGTARRSTAVFCTSVVSWVEAGLRKAAIGSVGGGLGTEAALGIEPVTSSLAGASLPPLVLFRIAKKPNPRIATTAIPRRVRRLEVSRGTAKRSPWRRAGWEFYSTGA